MSETIVQRPPSRILGACCVAPIAGFARPFEIESAESGEVSAASRITLHARRIELDVLVANLGVRERGDRTGISARVVWTRRGPYTRQLHHRDAHDNRAANNVIPGARAPRRGGGHHAHRAAARYGNDVEKVLCEPTLSVQSGSAPGLQMAWVVSSRSLKMPDKPVSTTSFVNVRPP